MCISGIEVVAARTCVAKGKGATGLHSDCACIVVSISIVTNTRVIGVLKFFIQQYNFSRVLFDVALSPTVKIYPYTSQAPAQTMLLIRSFFRMQQCSIHSVSCDDHRMRRKQHLLSPRPSLSLSRTFRLDEQARRWRYPEGPARRFLSHLLSYPLTLAAGIHEVGPPAKRGVSTVHSRGSPEAPKACPAGAAAEAGTGGHRIAVVCIGARAESTLPPAFWREALFALPSVSCLDLHLIGPEVGLPSGLAPPADDAKTLPLSAADGDGGEMRRRRQSPDSPLAVVRVGDRTAGINWTRAAVLGRTAAIASCVGAEDARAQGTAAGLEAAKEEAGNAAVERAIARADVFVLFNPGLGHPHLRAGWEGALERILSSGKPVIISCHSRKDLDRDARQLHAVGKRCCPSWADSRGVGIRKGENAFRSLMVSEDPLLRPDGDEVVSSNWGLLVVQGRGLL